MVIRLAPCLVVLIGLFPADRLAAGDEVEAIDYAIFRRGEQILVRLNLAQHLSAERVEQMKEGIDLAIEYRLALVRPKRFWGAEQVAAADGLVKIGYRIVTEDYSLSASEPGKGDRYFVSLAALHKFVSDSMVVLLTGLEDLNPRRRYVLKIKLTCISLTDLNLAADGTSTEDSRSAIKYLFTQFLRLTGFGREEYSLQTRPFSVSEINSED